ncbi:MAG: glucose-6-phosphate dehydrogenase [Spirochaetota bacterium]
MALFRGQYRVESARLPGYDYATPGTYFVTICTRHRQYFFGNIENNQVQYAEAGAIAAKIWEKIPGQFPYVELDEYIIMPNHVHGSHDSMTTSSAMRIHSAKYGPISDKIRKIG